MVILNKGQIAAQGEISKLKEVKYRLYEIKVMGEAQGFLHKLKKMGCKIEETEDMILKVYMLPRQNPQEIFRIASEEKIQIRQFVKSQTTLEDLFAKAVGVE